jgi:hypothetical protein
MTTRLEGALKRELSLNGKTYTLTITPEGLNLAPRVGKLASASASSAAPVASGLQQASR